MIVLRSAGKGPGQSSAVRRSESPVECDGGDDTDNCSHIACFDAAYLRPDLRYRG